MRFLPLLAALTAPLAAQPVPAPEPAETAPVLDRRGDVTLSVNGAFGPPGLGARLGVADGVVVELAVDRTPFARPDPSVRTHPFVAPGSRAVTLSANVEEGAAVTSWLLVSYGVQAFVQRQTDVVVVGYGETFEPLLLEGGRRVDQAGATMAARFEARVWGPLRAGFVGSYVGLGVQRARGGTVEVDGELARQHPDETRTRVVFEGGSTRFYVGVRL